MVYCVVVWLGFTEKNRRSLILTESAATTDDYIVANVKVTAVDVTQGLLHVRLRLIPKGRFAIDRATPAVDLKLLINSVSGNQTVLYPKGERISPVDFTSVLSGNLNRYPFDRYISDIDLLVTAPAPPAPPAHPKPSASRVPPAAPASPTPSASRVPPAASPTPTASRVPPAAPASPTPSTSSAASLSSAPVDDDDSDESPKQGDADPIPTKLVVVQSDLNESETVSIKENFVASITGLKFEGQLTQGDAYRVMRTSVVMRRANNVMTVSIVVMSVMFVLAVSIMVMALRVMASRDATNLFPLSLCVTLIFGLPALRNTQPGVPGIGALCDYISFMWAEFIVTTSAIGLAWTWIIHTIRAQSAKES